PKAFADLFSDEARFTAYLAVELAAVEAWAKLGVVPAADLAKIQSQSHIDVKRINELEAITRHDVVAFTRQIGETLGPEKKWIHYGLTSTDVVDTAMGLLYQKADNVIAQDLATLLSSIKDKALAYEMTPCIARTHGMHAEVTSFGLKWAEYYAELQRGIALFEEERPGIEACKMSGAVGNYANVDPFVQDYVAAKFSLRSADISTQVLSRDFHERYASALVIIASSLEKIATEIRNLSRSEIGEVEEGFAKGQKGSSAMPQKRNPIASENICGCARMMRGYLIPILEDNALYHERDISHSSVERVAFIDMMTLFDYMVERMNAVVTNLVVFPAAMRKNINLTGGAVYAQRVLTALIEKGLVREEAYDTIQPLAMAAAQGGTPFNVALKSCAKVTSVLSDEEIDALFTTDFYLRHVEGIYVRVGLIKKH
ncbi:MAG: adenylosuccinate lyase, partial [Bacilli bacterium]